MLEEHIFFYCLLIILIILITHPPAPPIKLSQILSISRYTKNHINSCMIGQLLLTLRHETTDTDIRWLFRGFHEYSK